MTCPDCGHGNLDGQDACEQCGQDLASVDIPRPTSGLQRTIMETPLRELEPAAALTVAPTEPALRVIEKMKAGRLGSALVLEGTRLVGIFTERDVLEKLAGRGSALAARPVAEFMTKDPVALREEDTLAVAMHRMAVGGLRHIPILEKGKPPRFVSVRGVLRYLNDHAR